MNYSFRAQSSKVYVCRDGRLFAGEEALEVLLDRSKGPEGRGNYQDREQKRATHLGPRVKLSH